MALETNLEANWSMEGNSNDNKGANNGTDTAISYGTAYGKYQQGALFNGSTSKIVVGNASALQTPPFTINAWIKPTYPSVYGMLFAGQGGANGLQYMIDNTGKMNLAKNSVAVQGTSNSAVGTGGMHMVTVTYDATTIKFYLDSVVDGTPASALTYAAQTMAIGTDTGNFFIGNVDEMSVWSAIKTSAEIITLWAGGNGMHFNGSIFVPNLSGALFFSQP